MLTETQMKIAGIPIDESTKLIKEDNSDCNAAESLRTKFLNEFEKLVSGSIRKWKPKFIKSNFECIDDAEQWWDEIVEHDITEIISTNA